MATSHLTKAGKRRLFVALASLLFTFGAYSQTCTATFSAENQKNVGSADEDGTSFTLNLTNTSSARKTYTFTATFAETSCATPNKSNLGNNVVLDVRFYEQLQTKRSAQSTELSAGQSRSIVVDVQVPSGTTFNRWSCIEINAIDMECGSVAATQLLRVFVPDPSDE